MIDYKIINDAFKNIHIDNNSFDVSIVQYIRTYNFDIEPILIINDKLYIFIEYNCKSNKFSYKFEIPPYYSLKKYEAICEMNYESNADINIDDLIKLCNNYKTLNWKEIKI